MYCGVCHHTDSADIGSGSPPSEHGDVALPGSGPAWIDYGIGVLVARGRIGAELGDALRAECRRRIDDGEFFAVLPFVSMLARKAATAAG